ncbi:MAG TPA: response regulator [Rickettsiales bacterium]|nr:response regulator [Rickettsiales bacterium]
MNAPLEKPHILVVDDDTRLRELLQTYLRDQGFAVTVAVNAKDARAKLALFRFDLMVLDVMMPGETGVELAHSLKREVIIPPILLLTAMAETEDRITGLETGADDYLTKPFEPRELVLRIQAILRRTNITSAKTFIQFGEFRFDLTNGNLQKNTETIFLTTSESQLLKTLAENSPEAVTRSDLAKSLGIGDNERNVDVQITRLRKKIEADSSRPVYIKTVRGSGYALSSD